MISNNAWILAALLFYPPAGQSANRPRYVNTDEGWELGTRDAKGHLQVNPKVGPTEATAAAIHHPLSLLSSLRKYAVAELMW